MHKLPVFPADLQNTK